VLKKIILICLASAALAGCGSSSSKPAANQTLNLTRAAYVSGGSQGYKVAMTLQEGVPSIGKLSVTGNGSFSSSAHTGSFTMQMAIPSAAAAQAGLSNLSLQMVLVPGTMYMKLPPQLAAKVPGGKPWWKIDLKRVGRLSGIPGLSSLINSGSNLNNPGQYLDFLRATSDGSVKNLGQATVNGIQTTHYHARIDLNKLPNAVPAADRAGVQQLITALHSRGLQAQGFPIDVWIDSSHLIRRIQLHYSQPLGGGQAADVAMQANYLSYGPQPAPPVPAPQDTSDLLTLFGR
jgi:hypothetical protein